MINLVLICIFVAGISLIFLSKNAAPAAKTITISFPTLQVTFGNLWFWLAAVHTVLFALGIFHSQFLPATPFFIFISLIDFPWSLIWIFLCATNPSMSSTTFIYTGGILMGAVYWAFLGKMIGWIASRMNPNEDVLSQTIFFSRRQKGKGLNNLPESIYCVNCGESNNPLFEICWKCRKSVRVVDVTAADPSRFEAVKSPKKVNWFLSYSYIFNRKSFAAGILFAPCIITLALFFRLPELSSNGLFSFLLKVFVGVMVVGLWGTRVIGHWDKSNPFAGRSWLSTGATLFFRAALLTATLIVMTVVVFFIFTLLFQNYFKGFDQNGMAAQILTVAGVLLFCVFEIFSYGAVYRAFAHKENQSQQ